MDTTFLATLTCPYCRSGLDIVRRSPHDGSLIDSGVVRCACYRYPIVDGIVVLRQTSAPFDTVDPAVVALEAGDVDGARRHLSTAASMVDVPARPRPIERAARSIRGLSRRRSGTSTGEERPTGGAALDCLPAIRRDLLRLRPRAYADYLYFRYANPSFVAAVPLLSVLESLAPDASRSAFTVLDLSCGIGHSTAMMRSLHPSATCVAADPDFINLSLLRRHLVPDALCVCLDAELPLPFADGAFEAVVCLDAFHYIRSKWALARELERVVTDDGVWLVPHLHNVAMTNVSPGIPLTAEDYVRLFGFVDVAVLDESVVLEGLFADGVLDLSAPSAAMAAPEAPVFSLVGSRRHIWNTYDVRRSLERAARSDPVGPNPIYRLAADDDVVIFDLEWPDPSMARECAAIERYLPSHVELDKRLLGRLQRGEPSADDHGKVAALLDRFVLVALPPGYRCAA
jgi:SAM-dependent methyltransferase/uncharacterized protein YbaR (Trm112 family)